ncbi:hydroxypyruvate isomerase family protein [Salinarimonas soli]|uniref:TIM barrel protein n=1 Tax=Salinarimonas soli TaxID=1638099 RepID=A0A5B2VR03_9HYPH|nr:TIM barrel protein [Salinarimonas soli]KAA2241030.1 TIM barrel protein [Salinarimonas soli]
MPAFTANIAFLFADRPFVERIDAARAAGFENVECHFPYDTPVETLKARLDGAGVRMTGLNTAPGDIRAGDWGLAGLIGREDDFEAGVRQAADYARALGTPMIHVMAGVVDEDARPQAYRTYVRNLRSAARAVAADGITLLLEPLNARDRPGYLVSRSDDIAELIGEIGEPNVRLLFDAYHVQIMEGDLIRRIERHAPVIGHVQIAAVPSRAEPDEGEVHFPAIFDALAANGYDGLIGLEYKPRGSTEEGLAWMDRLGVR